MPSTKEKMQNLGLPIDIDIDHILRCADQARPQRLSCLNISGDIGRHKSAFADTLAHALNPTHICYFEFGSPHETPLIIHSGDNTAIEDQTPLSAFDRFMTEACSFAEGDSTIIIIDQLQLAEFQEHMRIDRLICQKHWQYGDTILYANTKNIRLLLISEEPLNPALKLHSFRIHLPLKAQNRNYLDAQQLKLGDEHNEWIEPLNQLLETLNIIPSQQEYEQLMIDSLCHIQSIEHLQLSLLGRLEQLNHEQLSDIEPKIFQQLFDALNNNINNAQEIEIAAPEEY